MLRAFRGTRLTSLFAAIALFATMTVTITSVTHDGSDDPLCNPVVVAHNASAHQVGAAPATPQHSEHCVLCHLLQSRAIASAQTVAILPVDSCPISGAPDLAIAAPAGSRRPARAPPLA